MKPLNNIRYVKSILATVIATSSACSFADFQNAESDYSIAPQNYHVWNESLKPVDLVNNILCFTGQLKASEFINKGPYLALADEGACFKDDNSGSQSAQSSGASNTPSYTKIIVNATRASVNDPLIVKVWIPAMGHGGDEQQSIKFKSYISKGASKENPFGSFTFNYNFYESIDSTEELGGGEIKTIEIPGKIGFTFYEKESENENRVSEKGASVVMSSDRTTGIAFTFNRQQEGQNTQGDYYGLAFDPSNVLTQKADTYLHLPFNSEDPNTGTEACLSRTSFDESVSRYNLFDASTGASVKLNSGLSFKYDSDNDTTLDSYGYIGYWGMWSERPDSLSDGATIVVENPENHNLPGTNYTVSKAPGRLIKNTVQQLPITNIRGVQFNSFSPDAMQNGYQSWIVEYRTTAQGVGSNGFYKVAGSGNGENGPTQTIFETPILITLNQNEILNMNSEQLGGPVKYNSGDNFITFAKQEFINGSETAEGQLLASGNVTLYCVDRCPIGTLDGDDLNSWNTPFSNPIQSFGDASVFTFSTSGANALTLVRQSNGEPIRYANGLTAEGLSQSKSPYSWGIRSGSLITADVLDTLNTPWDIYNPEKVSVFYEWETGLNSFNQMVSVKDSNGAIQTFDKPIQFTYTHTDANDRSGDAGVYENKLTLLNYGGNGQLGGIPSTQDNDGRYVAGFTIADGTIVGPENEYIIKAQEIEGTMKPTPNECGNLKLTAPPALVPTKTTSNASDIGDMPVVTSAPKVIAGVIQQ